MGLRMRMTHFRGNEMRHLLRLTGRCSNGDNLEQEEERRVVASKGREAMVDVDIDGAGTRGRRMNR